jgi:putative membrane protein
MAANADRQANDQNFVAQAVQAGMVEVELGKIAMARSTNPDVRAFAARMVEDHTRANDELAALVNGHDIAVPSTLDADHRNIVTTVSARTGTDFDAAYAKQMASDHDAAVALFRSAGASNDLSPALSNFASRTVPALEEHKTMAYDLATKTERGY